MQARKALTAIEKEVAESEASLHRADDDIPPETLQSEVQEAADMLSELQLQVEPSKVAEIETKARRILTGLGFDEARTAKPVSSLSGGWKMRTALATVLLQESDILILDEPTNYLDLLGIIWLQRHLLALEDQPDPPTLILVSHDREFLTGAATDLLILKDKSLTYFHGDLPTYESAQAERKLHLTKMKDAQNKQKAHIQETIAKSIKAGKKNDDDNKLRQAKSRQKKLDDRWGLQVSARGGRFKLNRDLVGYHLTSREEIDVPQDERAVVVTLPDPAELRFPGALVGMEGVGYRYPKSSSVAAVLQGVSLSIHAGDRICVLGLNGAGKSTLIRLLVGESQPSTGTLTLHPRLKIGYYSQHAVENLTRLHRADPALTALSLLVREVEGLLAEGEVRGLLASLGLSGRTASDVPLGKLSGGQLVRVELARLLWRRPQLLVLDEVTTHLDYETVVALRGALRRWEGAVVVVSHDRWFVKGVVEGEGEQDGDEDEDDLEEEEMVRRRIVYWMKGGKLADLKGGVREFEEKMERRVGKLMHSKVGSD
jgi:ATPase subunit of ABC transporter with duplicated ATPase domains